MTCLVAVQHDKHIYYGGDRCESQRYTRRSLGRSKWIVFREWRIGVAGSSKLGTLMATDNRWRSALSPIGEESAGDVDQFARAMQAIVETDPTWIHEKCESNPGGFSVSFIVVGPPGVFSIGTSFDVSKHAVGDMAAVGTGDHFALGAYEICRRLAKRVPMSDQITMCLEAAAANCPSVMGPFDVDSIEVSAKRSPGLWANK